jgi:voltage-gated potassium channel Kch
MPMKFWSSKDGMNNPYTQLLITLILLLVSSPLASKNIEKLFVSLVFVVNLLIIINLLHLRKKSHKIVYFILAFLSVLLQTIDLEILAEKSHILNILSSLVNLFFISIAIHLMTKNVFTSRRITSDLLKGGICVYLLIGVWFIIPYIIIYNLDNQAFLLAYSAKFDPIYFSYVTLTTTGYGDIIPINPYARMFANLEAIVGVLYTGIIIARLVSLYVIEDR